MRPIWRTLTCALGAGGLVLDVYKRQGWRLVMQAGGS